MRHADDQAHAAAAGFVAAQIDADRVRLQRRLRVGRPGKVKALPGFFAHAVRTWHLR
jgi:hypothetical protein